MPCGYFRRAEEAGISLEDRADIVNQQNRDLQMLRGMFEFKPAGAPGKLYSGGFTTQTALAGSLYIAPPSGTPALTLSNATCNVLVTTGAGDLASFVSNQVAMRDSA